MRQKKYQIIDRQEIEAILLSNRVGRLATVGLDGYPYITPLNYVFWQGKIYMHCALQGERLTNIEKDIRVGFEVDEPLAYLDTGFTPQASACGVTQLYRSVIIKGIVHLVTDVDAKVAVLNTLVARHEGHSNFAAITADMKAVEQCHVLELTIEHITGKHNVGAHRSASYRAAVASYLPELEKDFLE